MSKIKKKGVNLDKIDWMAYLAFHNAIRLHEDSILLFKNRRYPSAFFLSVLALEEIGKMYMLEDFLYHSRFDGRFNDMADDDMKKELGEDLEAAFLEEIYYHPPKQKWFINNAVTLENRNWYEKGSTKLHKAIFSNELQEDKRRSKKRTEYREENLKKYQHQFRRANLMEKLKHNSIYVGFDRIGKNINLKGKIKHPFTIKRKRALDQITYVNDFFIVYILGLVKQVYGTESYYLESFVKKEMANKLLKLWRYRKLDGRRQLKRIQMAK